MTLPLSAHEKLLMQSPGDGLADETHIQSNSMYDQTIDFDDGSSDDSAPMAPVSTQNAGLGHSQMKPGEYSPRPDPSEETPNFSNFKQLNHGLSFGAGNDLQSFELNFQSSGDFNAESRFTVPGKSSGFSPRPSNVDQGPSPMTSPELAQLFGLIAKFQPPPLELTPHYKPFLPEIVPAIGSIDAFIKVPRPDNEQDPLGLTGLDEPTIGQADPQILRMQLREKFGIVNTQEGDGYIGYIRDAPHNQKALDSFLASYDEISRNRPAPTMAYSYKMPELEELMEEFPSELIDALNTVPIPSADLDLTLDEYVKVICSFLDIPVKGNNLIESLHVFFSLFQEFKTNPYFQSRHTPSRGSTPQRGRDMLTIEQTQNSPDNDYGRLKPN